MRNVFSEQSVLLTILLAPKLKRIEYDKIILPGL